MRGKPASIDHALALLRAHGYVARWQRAGARSLPALRATLEANRAYWQTRRKDQTRRKPFGIVHAVGGRDSPWCTACGAKRRENCRCGPMADND